MFWYEVSCGYVDLIQIYDLLKVVPFFVDHPIHCRLTLCSQRNAIHLTESFITVQWKNMSSSSSGVVLHRLPFENMDSSCEAKSTT